MINPGVITAALLVNRTVGGFPLAGINFDRLALGIGIAVSAWGINQQQNLSLRGTTSGLVGAGDIEYSTTKLTVPPNIPIMQAGLIGAGMVGPLAPSLAVVVAMSISQSFTAFGQYRGTSSGVGVGSDISSMSVANPVTLIAMLMANLTVTLGPGLAMPMLATGLGIGIAGVLIFGTGSGAVSGASGPSPGGGTSQSTVV